MYQKCYILQKMTYATTNICCLRYQGGNQVVLVKTHIWHIARKCICMNYGDFPKLGSYIAVSISYYKCTNEGNNMLRIMALIVLQKDKPVSPLTVRVTISHPAFLPYMVWGGTGGGRWLTRLINHSHGVWDGYLSH